jgi:hypothetical protein
VSHLKRYLALWGMAVLLACVSQPAAQPIAAAACETTTADALLTAMRQGGVEPVKDLKGPEAVRFLQWLALQGATVPEGVTRVIIWSNGSTALIALFAGDCFLAHAFGPAKVLTAYFGPGV